MRRSHILLGLTLGLLLPAIAARADGPTLKVVEAWTRATPPGSKTGAGYLTVQNGGDEDRLLSASTPRAGRVEIHGMSMTGGVMKMWHEKEGATVPKGGRLTLAPGGTHLMFFEVGSPLREGEKIPLTLRFQKAGSVQVELLVMPIGAKGPSTQPSSQPSSRPNAGPAERSK